MEQQEKESSQNKVAYNCADCNKLFKAGDSIFYNKENEPICEECNGHH